MDVTYEKDEASGIWSTVVCRHLAAWWWLTSEAVASSSCTDVKGQGGVMCHPASIQEGSWHWRMAHWLADSRHRPHWSKQKRLPMPYG